MALDSNLLCESANRQNESQQKRQHPKRNFTVYLLHYYMD